MLNRVYSSRSGKTSPLRHFAFRQYLPARVVMAVAFAMLAFSGNATAQTPSLPAINQVDSGTPEFGTYNGLHDNVSVMSGNLSFCIPLVSLPGLNKHNLTIPLCYNSQYEVPTTPSANSNGMYPVPSWFPWTWNSNAPVMGPGWTLTGRVGLFQNNAVQTIPTIVTPNGTKYSVPSGQPPNNGSIFGPDWSGGDMYVSSPTNGWIYQKNGTRTTAALSNTTQEYDSYGSLITFTPTSVTDTIGRTVSVSASTGSSPASLSFQYPDSNGTQRTVTINFTTITSTCGIGESSYYGIGGTYSMPSAVLLPNGLTYTFQYDTCGNLLKVTYPSGGYTRYAYNLESAGLWVSGTTSGWQGYHTNEIVAEYACPTPAVGMGALSAASGNTCPVTEEVTTYAPVGSTSSTGNLSSTVTDPLGNYVTYEFTSPQPAFFIPSVESQRSYFNAAGQLLKTVSTTYTSGSVGYPAPTLPATQTTMLDNRETSQIVWTYNYQIFTNADSPLIEKDEYDFGPNRAPGPLLRKTKYDWLQLDNWSRYGWTGAHILDRITNEAVYDPNNNLVSQTTYQYDNGGTSPAVGYLTAESQWLNTTNTMLTTSYVWGPGGITQVTDPKGNITSYNYTDNYADGVNRNSNAYPTTITHPATSGAAHIEQRQYYYGSGLVAATCGENFAGTCKAGLSSAADYTSYTYDLMGRRVSTTTGDGGSSTTCFSDVSGGSCYTGTYPLQVQTTEGIAFDVVKVSSTTLDGEGKTTQTKLITDPSCSTGSLVVTTYDLDERVSTKSNPYCTTSDSTYGVTTSTYDGLSRLAKLTNPDGTSATNTYTGRAILSADEGNGTVAVQSISQKDALGRMTAVCEISTTTQKGAANYTPSSCGLDVGGSGFGTGYGYDLQGNLLSVSQGGVGRSFTYDSLSRILSATNPESGTTHYAYDQDNNLTSKTTAAGITTTYSYDALNRLLGKTYSDGTTPAACFQYDQGTRAVGRLSTEWTESASSCPSTPPTSGILTERTLAEYDLMGRVATDQQCSTPGSCTGTPYTVSYGYNAAGDLTSFSNGLIGTSAMELSNTYDSADRLATMVGPVTSGSSYAPTNLFAEGSYNASGAIVSAQVGAGINLQRAYNKRLLPISETDQTGTVPGTATIQITGSEQFSGVSTGAITFSGTEQSMVSGGQTVYAGGLFLIFINGGNEGNPYQITYGEGSTAPTLAATLASQISCSSGPVNAVAVGGTVNLTSCASGTGTNYSLSAYSNGSWGGFSTPSFAIAASGATMTIPAATYATGTLTFDGTEQSITNGGATTYENNIFEISTRSGQYGGPISLESGDGSTASSLASTLASEVPPCSSTGEYFSALANGPVVTLTSCTAGTAGNYPVTVSASEGGGGFTTPSFTLTASGSRLTGGVNSSGAYDEGYVNLTVSGTVIASVPYNAGSTPTSIAQALVTSGNGNGLVALSSSGANLTMTASGDGTITDYTYAVNITSQVFASPSFSSSSKSGNLAGGENVPLYSWAINSYAPNGDVLSVTDSVMGTWAYTYDDLNRLITGSASVGSMAGLSLGWDYDRYGNRWDQNASGSGSAVQTHFTFSGNNNRIDQYSSSYDADGNLKSDGTNSYIYDAENRIITLNGQPTYIYDAEGRRVAKYSGGTIASTYILGLGGQQITELSGSGTWKHSNVFTSAGKLLATYEGPGGTAAAGYHYHLNDWLGTERMQTNNSGSEDEICISYPFGDGLTCTGPQPTDATEQHYTGKERDAESGLDYFGARYYASNMGRWMSPDWSAKEDPVPYAVLGDPQSLNLYGYVGNNPLGKADADGHCWPWCPAQVADFVGGAAKGAFASLTGGALGSRPSSSDSPASLKGQLFGTAGVAAAGIMATADGATKVVGGALLVPETGPVGGGIAVAGAAEAAVGAVVISGASANATAVTAAMASQPTSNPWQGQPGSTSQTAQPNGSPKQVREYGSDGYPKTDVDYGHDHGQGDPHAHDIGRPADGSPPTHVDRGPGRPVQPNDPKPQ